MKPKIIIYHRIVCLIVIAFCLIVNHLASAITLQYNLKKGDIAKYKILMTGQSTISMMGQQQLQNLAGEFNYIQEVIDVDKEGNFIIKISFKINKLTLNNQPISPQIIKLPDNLILKMTKQGKILEIKGIEQLSQAQATTGIDWNLFINQLSSLGELPARDINIGDSWQNEVKLFIANSQPIIVKSVSKLDSINKIDSRRQAAKILTQLELPADFLKGILQQQLLGLQQQQILQNLDIRGSIKINQVSYFDLQASILLKGSTTSASQVNISFDIVNPLTAESQPFTISMNMTTTAQLTLLP